MKSAAQRGFALPTVLLASIVMMIVLMTALVASSGSRAMLDEQHYQKISRSTAESGLVMAEACLRENDMIATWTNIKPLRPNTDCNGDTVSGRDGYAFTEDTMRSTFEVGVDTTSPTNYTVRATGITDQIRVTTGQAWRTHTETLMGNTFNVPATATSVASGRYQVCAILSERTWCNGGNEQGQMGNGRIEQLDDTVYVNPEPVLREPGLLDGRTDKLVGSGTGRACTVTTDNEIFCWGSSGYGSLGVGYSPPNPYPRPIQVAKPAGMTGEITRIAMGFHATCVISGGDLWCWGRNNYGQLGDNSNTTRLSPIRVPSIGAHVGRPVTDVHSQIYADSFCAVADGDAYCWGRNNHGQLGDNSTTTRRQPTLVRKMAGRLAGKTASRVITVYAPRTLDGSISSDGVGPGCLAYDRNCYTTAYSCTSTTNGEMYCWGSNQYGQMGQGEWTNSNQLVPVRIMGALNGKFVRDIAGSYRTPCALTTDSITSDRLFCWGGNQSAAGGLSHNVACDNSTEWRRSICSPTPVVMQSPGLLNKYIDSIDAGVNRMCAIAEGAHYCTGLNSHGQIGDGTTINRMVMTEATAFRQYKPIIIY